MTATGFSWVSSKRYTPLSAADVSAVLGYPIDDSQTRTLSVIVKPGYDLLAMAPTGSGKTAVALQAILQAFRRGKKAVYTSPIKALSNQKYRELSRRFGEESVGLITGDASLNPTAPCLIMTTEILRGMIHRNASAVVEADFVIFDEIHYINDLERGVVVRSARARLYMPAIEGERRRPSLL